MPRQLGEQGTNWGNKTMLTDADCKNALCPPDKKRARLTDAGGLYLEISPAGSKRWFLKYRAAAKEMRLALGTYPAVSLKAARQARDEAKRKKSDGIDPVQARKVEKLKAINPAGDTFQIVAQEWLAKQTPQWSEAHAIRQGRQLERDLFPWLGARRIADIAPVELLAALRKVEERGAIETADRCLMLARQIWRYGLATGRVSQDITLGLKEALQPYRGRHFGAITEPADFAVLLRAIKAYKGGIVVRAALQLAPMLFQRPNELRGAAWAEMDLEAGLWTIPAKRMKRTKDGKEFGHPHLVPLPKQAIAILKALHPYTVNTGLVFPGERQRSKPISDNSVRTALISLGYTAETQTWHGFRASARTMLAEVLNIDPLVIEAQLAHSVRDANGRAYNRTTYLNQRTAMMQKWADYLDRLAKGGQVIAFKQA